MDHNAFNWTSLIINTPTQQTPCTVAQGTERAVLQAPRQTLGVERVRARQPAGAGRVHRGHADAAGRTVAVVGRARGLADYQPPPGAAGLTALS